MLSTKYLVYQNLLYYLWYLSRWPKEIVTVTLKLFFILGLKHARKKTKICFIVFRMLKKAKNAQLFHLTWVKIGWGGGKSFFSEPFPYSLDWPKGDIELPIITYSSKQTYCRHSTWIWSKWRPLTEIFVSL